jgi:hypothetical protein
VSSIEFVEISSRDHRACPCIYGLGPVAIGPRRVGSLRETHCKEIELPKLFEHAPPHFGEPIAWFARE